MKIPAMTSHRLGHGDFLKLRGRPVRLAAECGTLWVTQDGHPEDVEIGAGQSREFDGRSPLVVGTLGGDARVGLTWLSEPVRPAPLRWLRQVRRGAFA